MVLVGGLQPGTCLRAPNADNHIRSDRRKLARDAVSYLTPTLIVPLRTKAKPDIRDYPNVEAEGGCDCVADVIASWKFVSNSEITPSRIKPLRMAFTSPRTDRV